MAKKAEMSREILLCQAGTLASAIPTTFCLGQTIQLSAQIAATTPSKVSFDVAAVRQSKPSTLVAAIRDGLTRSLDNGVAKYVPDRRGGADMRVCVAIVALGLFSCERLAQARPLPEEQSRAIETARANALTYAKSLPDFIYTEVAQFFTRGGWAGDKVALQLSYVDGKEKYNLLTINGKPTNQPVELTDGLVTEGESGTMLFNISLPTRAPSFKARVER